MPTSSVRAALVAALCVTTGPHAVLATDDAQVGVVDRPAMVDVTALADGDLVFRRGHDAIARLVLTQGDAPRFSHVGIVVLTDGRAEVLHAMPGEDGHVGGVVREPLAMFANSANAADAAVYRVRALDAIARARVRAFALAQLGTPFDADFRLSDSTRVYCTEFALRALTAAGVPWVASVPTTRVFVLTEPVVPPDFLRRMPALTPVAGALHGAWESPWPVPIAAAHHHKPSCRTPARACAGI